MNKSVISVHLQKNLIIVMKKKKLIVRTKTLGILSDIQMSNLKGGCTGVSCVTGANNPDTGNPTTGNTTTTDPKSTGPECDIGNSDLC